MADLPEHLAKFGKEIDQVPGNGKCFIESVKHCMKHDLGIHLEDHDIRNITLQEMVQRIDFYHEFHPEVNPTKMLAQAELFLINRNTH